MSNLARDKQYDQLNQRSRWYSSQMWYVPFAFVGIIALGIDKSIAASYAFLQHLIGLIPICILGFIYFLEANVSFKDIRKAQEYNED